MKIHRPLLALLTATLCAATSTFAAEASTERTHPQDANPECRDRDSKPCVLDDGRRPRPRVIGAESRPAGPVPPATSPVPTSPRGSGSLAPGAAPSGAGSR